MKYLQRFCCLLLCFLLLFPVFSLNASAKGVDIPDYIVTSEVYVRDVFQGDVLFNPRDENIDTYVNTDYVYTESYASNSAFPTDTYWTFKPIDKNVLLKKGEETEIKINNCYFWHKVVVNGGDYPSSVPDSMYITVYYTDGTIHNIDLEGNVNFSISGNPLNINFTFTPTRDVLYFKLHIEDTFKVRTGGTTTLKYYYKIGEYDNASSNGFYLEVEQSTKEEKLLGGIIEWLKGIKNGITDLFDSIAELPSKLWSAIENGLKALFVPDEDYLISYKDKWNELLSSRFGALYQVSQVIIDFGESIKYTADTGNIIFPQATINLGNGNQFTFGGYNVNLIPSGFAGLANIIKAFTTACCCFLFVNGLRKRYDKLMGEV